MTTATLSLPRFNGWMLPDDALGKISELICERLPALVVEAGSGRSTVMIADMLRDIGHGTIVSLEHQADFALATKHWLVENNLDEFAEVRYAPLTTYGDHGLLAGEWYDSDGWSDLEGINMLLVDGPPGHTSERARGPALPLLRDRLAPFALVVLDDTHRPEERAIIDDWRPLTSNWTQVRHSTGALSYGVMA